MHGCYKCARLPPSGTTWPVRRVALTSWDGLPGAIREPLCDDCDQQQTAEAAEWAATLAQLSERWRKRSGPAA